MTRKMAWIGSFYLIGLFAASFFDFSVNFIAAAVLIGFSAMLFGVYGKVCMKMAVCMLSAAAGFFLYSAYDFLVYENVVKYDGYDVEVKGKIVSFTEYSGDNSSYTVKGVINGDVSAVVTFFTDSSFADVGDIVSIAGKAAVLKDSYTFPAKSYYKAKGIYLQINSVKDFSYSPGGFSLKRVINKYREYLLDIVSDCMDADSTAIMSAMLFGDKSDIDSAEKTLMYRAGIGHIMAVSGVHLSVVCSFFWFFLSRMPINKYLRFGILLIPIFCFVLLAGMTNSVIRAAVMIVLVYGAGLFKRRADTFNSLGIAVIVLTVFSPFAVRDASFLLSVTGVFGIGVAAPAVINEVERKRKIGDVLKAVVSSFCVMAVVFPVSLLFFDEVSVISPLSNLLLLPICEIILIGGIIVTVTGGVGFIAVPVLKICEICCKVVTAVSEFIGGLRFSYIPLGSRFAFLGTVSAVCVIAAALVLYRNKRYAVKFSIALIMVLITLINIYRYIPDGKITVAVLKEKSAVTAVIHDKRSACVIDLNKGGKAVSSVLKYLNKNGIYKLNPVVLNVDANTSLPVYSNNFKLFNLYSFLVPEEDMFLTSGYKSTEIMCYNKENCSADMGSYNVEFVGKGVIIIKYCGAEVILYGSDIEGFDEEQYGAAVRYNGKTCEADPNSPIIAVMSDEAEVSSENRRSVYIGENVKIMIDADGTVTSEKLS